jgi:DNA-binding SARP family transcriptional activator
VSARLASVEIRLLGGFTVCVAEKGLSLTPASERLLAFLALRGVMPRDSIAFKLWADHTEEHAHGCLRSALWRLPKPCDVPLVQSDAGRLRLADHLLVDVQIRRQAARTWLDPAGPPPGLRADLFTSDLLPGWYDDWLVIERERYRQLRLHVLEQLSDWLTRRGCFAEAIEAGLHAVAGDPLRESAHRCIVRAHLGEGNFAEAVRQTRVYLKLLVEAGLPPRLSPQMESLTMARSKS